MLPTNCHTKILFFDASCRLCRHEIGWLAPKLADKLTLVDISQDAFTGHAGVSKSTMLAQIHLWDGQRFLIGLDATLYYWRLAGMRLLPWLLALPGVNAVAQKAYLVWASRRQRCNTTQCQ